LLEDTVAGIWAGVMDGDSPNVGTSDEDNNDDVRCRHLPSQSFWVKMLKLNILTPLSLNPLDMSMVQKNFISHFYSAGGDGCIIVGSGRQALGKGNIGEEETEEDKSSGGGKR
jgi:hypothetical protein